MQRLRDRSLRKWASEDRNQFSSLNFQYERFVPPEQAVGHVSDDLPGVLVDGGDAGVLREDLIHEDADPGVLGHVDPAAGPAAQGSAWIKYESLGPLLSRSS